MPDASLVGSAIRAIPARWFRPNRAIYWTDLLASAAIGWAAFGAAVAAAGRTRAALLAVGALALYRAVLFIHEITHLARRDVPGFRPAWNAVVGVPLLLPSFLYEGVHTDHHRQHGYGTRADPEYVPFSRRPPSLIAGFAVASLLLPVALAVRFGVLAPLSWVVPPLRRVVVERASALVINHEYVRRAPMDVVDGSVSVSSARDGRFTRADRSPSRSRGRRRGERRRWRPGIGPRRARWRA